MPDRLQFASSVASHFRVLNLYFMYCQQWRLSCIGTSRQAGDPILLINEGET